MATRIASGEWADKAFDLANRMCDLPDILALPDVFAEFRTSRHAKKN